MINYLGRSKLSPHQTKIAELFRTEICGLITDGHDFCIARVVMDDTGHFYIDAYQEWSWNLSSPGDIFHGFTQATYDEVESCGDGYYLFTTRTEMGYEDGHPTYWTYPDNFIKHVTLDEIEGAACELDI